MKTIKELREELKKEKEKYNKIKGKLKLEKEKKELEKEIRELKSETSKIGKFNKMMRTGFKNWMKNIEENEKKYKENLNKK